MRDTKIQVRILGTIEVAGAASPEVIGPRVRRLLARLAVSEDVVSEADLIDAVWSDRSELPANPTRSLQTYISRLRSQVGGDAIVRVPPGYRLDGQEVSIDARELESLLADAEAAVSRADDRGAVQHLELALELWTGASLGECSGEIWATGEAHRLDELRIDVQERRAELLLGLGDLGGSLIADLEALTVDNPHREGPVRLLMLALHRGGRQADALAAFARHRQRLATDLGLEPSEILSELEDQILRNDGAATTLTRARSLRGYEVLERLGEGAFSIVYRGSQPSVGRDVAIKQIRAELANRPEFVRRFETEAHLVARLEHPHIVPLFDYWREPDSAYLVMRLLRGGSLEGALRSGAWGLGEAKTMVEQVGGALSIAHRAGVVHRDVKPANILLDEDGNAYLTDFGIALDAAEAADPDAALSAGSPAYASPEQLRREPVGPSADVHGLAIATYEALTARLPFPDEPSKAALLQRQLRDPIPPVRESRPDIPAGVDDVLARATAKKPTDRYQSIEEFVTALAEAATPAGSDLARAVVGTAVTGEERNPYKGLRAFDEADVGDYAGRARLVDQLLEVTSANRLVAVVGPSGSGKSSVVRAGLLPQLRTGAVAGSDQWFFTTLLPGSNPFEELETALLRIATDRPSDLLGVLGDGERGIARGIRHVLPEDEAQLLLVIDQFEELFTLPDPNETRRFLDALAVAVTEERPRLRVVLTLRADFYDRPLGHEAIGRLVKEATVAVLPLAPDELEHAIVDPAAAVGAEYEPGLVSEIVADVADQPSSLPLLQYALTELYEQRVSGLLTRDSYHKLGGVAGALAQRAEELYEQADERQRRAVRAAFGRLVSLGEGTEDTRRRVVRSELGSSEATTEVLERYGRARLLSFDRDRETREPTVEVAHEALLREWPRLRGWLDDDREDLRILRHVTAAANEWESGGRPPSELYRGGRLETAEAWAEGSGVELRDLEREFLDASSRQNREERELERRRVRRLRSLLGLVAAVAVIAVIAGILAVVQQRRATTTATRADVQRLATESSVALGEDPDLAILLALEAFDRAASLDETPGAVMVALQQATQGSRLIRRMENTADWLTVSSDGTVLASGSAEQPTQVLLHDVRSGEQRGGFDAGAPISGVAFSPGREGLFVAFETERGQAPSGPIAAYFETASGRRLAEFDGPCCAVPTPKILPGGRFAVGSLFSGDDTFAAAWDLEDPNAGTIELSEATLGGGWGPAGELVVFDDRGVSLVDPATGEIVDAGLPDQGAIDFASISPADGRIVTTSGNGIQIWEQGASEPVAVVDSRLPTVTFAVFTGDGRRLYVFGQDDEIRLIDIETGDVTGLRGHAGAISGFGRSSDDSVLVAASNTGEIRLWDLSRSGPSALGNIESEGFVWEIQPEAEGSTVLVSEILGPNTRVRRFDAATGVPLDESTLFGLGSLVASSSLRVGGLVADGPAVIEDIRTNEVLLALDDCERLGAIDDRGELALVARDGDCGFGAAVVRVDTGEVISTWPDPTGFSDFGPTGTIAEGLLVWQRGEGAEVALEVRRFGDDTIVAEIPVNDAWRPFFSNDGRHISFGSETAGGWGIDVEQILAGTPWEEAALNKLVLGGPTTFTMAGAGYLVTGHSGETLRFWGLDDGEEWLSLPVATNGPTMHAFTADGRYHYYADAGGVVRRFPLVPDELAELARGRVQRRFTAEECSRFGVEEGCEAAPADQPEN